MFMFRATITMLAPRPTTAGTYAPVRPPSWLQTLRVGISDAAFQGSSRAFPTRSFRRSTNAPRSSVASPLGDRERAERDVEHVAYEVEVNLALVQLTQIDARDPHHHAIDAELRPCQLDDVARALRVEAAIRHDRGLDHRPRHHRELARRESLGERSGTASSEAEICAAQLTLAREVGAVLRGSDTVDIVAIAVSEGHADLVCCLIPTRHAEPRTAVRFRIVGRDDVERVHVVVVSDQPEHELARGRLLVERAVDLLEDVVDDVGCVVASLERDGVAMVLRDERRRGGLERSLVYLALRQPQLAPRRREQVVDHARRLGTRRARQRPDGARRALAHGLDLERVAGDRRRLSNRPRVHRANRQVVVARDQRRIDTGKNHARIGVTAELYAVVEPRQIFP